MLEQIGDVIYKVEEVESAGRVVFDEKAGKYKPFVHVVRTHHCFARKLVIEGNTSTTINTPLTLTVRLLDWNDNPLNESLEVRITAKGVTIVLELVDGVGDFDFVSPIAGTFKIEAQADRCDEGTGEVVVYEG
jgi:hypothetical protein